MGNKVTDELVATVRSIVGSEYSEMDIVRALHMANNDATAAINIIFDTPNFKSKGGLGLPKKPELSCRNSSSEPRPTVANTKQNGYESEKRVNCCSGTEDNGRDCPSKSGDELVEDVCQRESSFGSEWWLVGCGELAGLSTCKGRRIKPGDEVVFAFPASSASNSPSPGKVFGRGRHVVSCSEIVRFSTRDSGEIGRIPKEWARCLFPLVRDKKIRIEGCCKYAPDVLTIMDTIDLSISVYINSSIFSKQHHTSFKAASSSSEESVFHPLPILFHLLGMTPFKKAEFTPSDLYTRKRALDSKGSSCLHASTLHVNKSKNPSKNGNEVENEEFISDADLENIVGFRDSSELEEMEPPGSLLCELRQYQKQALYWMVQLEKGRFMDVGATTLHPCWEAYHLADKRGCIVYLNAFSGDATTEFPSTLQMARGGILADAMGLGKTIMTIALLLDNSEGGGSSVTQPTNQSSTEGSEVGNVLDNSLNISKKVSKFPGFNKYMKKKNTLIDGGNLIICPMTLLGQWKAEIETHSQPGSLSLYVHYGQSRPKDAKSLAQSNVVITTYGVLASEFSTENAEDNGGLYSVRWFRIVLDEAHTIKSSRSQISMAATALVADRRWCLTGTPIQNKLEDIYSLLRFLRVEPWGNWAWWNKLIQKPFEEGDERGLKLVQSILKPIMLRRTKFSTDREGRPILVLPPADSQVIYCELTEAERDFYDALFKRSKVKFDQFVEQGRVLHNYASILELLLLKILQKGKPRINLLELMFKRFWKSCVRGARRVPNMSQAFEDAVLTPCAHRICRECLLASWRNATSGLCPVCRKVISRQDLITAPTESRFKVDIDKNWVESSKVVVLLRELETLRLSGSKSIVFSQWTAFLDLLQIPLSRNNIPFLRLDGTLNQQQREKQFGFHWSLVIVASGVADVIEGWRSWNKSNCSFQCICVGSMVESSCRGTSCYAHPSHWTDKRVMIKRFIVKGTVEERMEAVQARKQRMISGALTDQEVRSARIEELKMLFT
ncbi:hypothetical protein FNV43_RR05570 [Rhamnella rubrinervis]|uniref:Uncharacterized protein n=1 Tax=Rhamnella rubrinervis TaxID=2594499 RepID=A0A8K0MQS7_9ROSA|nr:hypothetical protein FNV43_RR05570 [Rhamnella rubrinervis]